MSLTGSSSQLSYHSFPSLIKILVERDSIKYFIISTVYILTLLLSFDKKLTLIINALWLLPQIVLNAHIGGRPKFYSWFYSIICFNQIYSLYLLGYPENIYQTQPRYTAFMSICLIIIFQWLILYIQSTHGGRFFIPKQFIPGYY
jgi:hypothetical protein